jgi:hypothetical protein
MEGQSATNDKELQFSCYSGSMLLSFCAVESFMNSIAFLMSRDQKYKEFIYPEYDQLKHFWDRMGMVCKVIGIAIDKSSGIFQVIDQMRGWRNSLVHSSPYSIEITEIVSTKHSRKLHRKYEYREYSKSVRLERAKKFYLTTGDLIKQIQKVAGFNPRAMCSYKQV